VIRRRIIPLFNVDAILALRTTAAFVFGAVPVESSVSIDVRPASDVLCQFTVG
jgi:hypothetical protein